MPGQFKIGRNERGFKMKQKEHAALIFQDDPDALLLTPVAAEFLGISPKYLRKLRTTGGGPEYVRLSHTSCAYTRKALMAWIKSRTYRTTSQEKASLPSVSVLRS